LTAAEQVNNVLGSIFSDDRLKHNEIDIADGLSTIMKLNPQTYDKTQELLDEDFNGDFSSGDYIKESGFIAQEVNEINELQHLVTEGDDNTPYSLNYAGIIPYNTKAIQELKLKNDELKNRVDDLEFKLNSIYQKLNISYI
jgi:hypothetical protein